ncbi:universal stress protein [Mucilaginibacter boryungensis]|uniref:Universal stress protein n=1 Tax=Mucilaginibacter boryungensis TaxID=768480 RepID=A0ABR9XET0_9SPHI|nr:universal stress protein [Mucilaginibacter boryungensis]MBE9665692.1 universal stress protein [Mucilaginibacter boryungensis]
MKTILVPTDFSPAAENAAGYALFLSQHLQADLLLTHAFKVPAETRVAVQAAWPLEDYEEIKLETNHELDLLRHKLEHEVKKEVYPPVYQSRITGITELGDVTTTIRNLVDQHHAPLTVMGMSGSGLMHRFLLGSASRDLLEKATFPVLLVPAKPMPNKLNKIAFATDLSKTDIDIIHSLTSLARPFNAEILIAHITDSKYDPAEHRQQVDEFLNEVTCKADYPNIYYRHVQSMDVDHGLHWLVKHGMIDMLAMVHRTHPVLEKLINGSYTQRVAKYIHIPLLVFPPDTHDVYF